MKSGAFVINKDALIAFKDTFLVMVNALNAKEIAAIVLRMNASHVMLDTE